MGAILFILLVGFIAGLLIRGKKGDDGFGCLLCIVCLLGILLVIFGH